MARLLAVAGRARVRVRRIQPGAGPGRAAPEPSRAPASVHAPALRMLARNFADPEVGGVCGNQIYVREGRSDSSASGETLYWSYDKWLKRLESLTGSIVSSDGAIYAIRRRLYRKPARAYVT